jgi:hypothetical protein
MNVTRAIWTCAVLARLAIGASATGVVNIQDYGAVPNDGKDDSAAIQAAFAALDPNQGGTVLCPPGTYDIFEPIVVTSSSVRFTGVAGPSYNESPPYAGCMLVAHTNGMTLLQFSSTSLNQRGPIVEEVNMRDSTPAGNSATLLSIVDFNRWTVRNVTLNYAAIGLYIDGPDDASWGYIPQLFCKNSNTCIDQSTINGGFLLLGGGLEPLITGIRVRGPQVRVAGVKFDCVNGSMGMYITGHADVVTASTFEECGTGISVVNDDSEPWNGAQNSFVGNHFIGTDIANSIGISLGTGASGNQLIGNTYEYTAVNVTDRGSGTVRMEQGMGLNGTVSCEPRQGPLSLQIQNGIITGSSCGPAARITR